MTPHTHTFVQNRVDFPVHTFCSCATGVKFIPLLCVCVSMLILMSQLAAIHAFVHSGVCLFYDQLCKWMLTQIDTNNYCSVQVFLGVTTGWLKFELN